MRRSLHLLARLVIAVTCTSSAAAFDAAHVLHTADLISQRGHLLGAQRHEAKPNGQPSSTDCALLGNTQPAAQQEIPVQPGRTEEIGKQ